jgi:serine protease Do
VIALGHPGGYKEGRTPPVRLGRVLNVKSDAIRTDCTLVGGDTGGPLVDMRGKVVGINSRIGPKITQNIHAPVDSYGEDRDRLLKGDTWGGGFFAPGPAPGPLPYLGITLDLDQDDCRIDEVTPGSPAFRAGLKPNDVLLKLSGLEVKSKGDLGRALAERKVGEEAEVEVRRGERTLTKKVKLGERPEPN